MRFAGCEIDLAARRLVRNGRPVHLSPKAFELLKLLLENRPRALSKAELVEHVWQGVFVSDSSLARAINEVRVGLGAEHRNLLRTLYGYGYAFAADVDTDEGADRLRNTAPLCWLTDGTREFVLHDGDHVAGRGPAASIRLDSPKVSRHHARFSVRGASVTVEDLRSKNGTFVDGTRIELSVPLKRGDEVRIGPFALVLSVATPSISTETEVTLTPRVVTTSAQKESIRMK